DLINNTTVAENKGTFGVLGKWGRGKTYFIDHLKDYLLEKNGFENIIIDFSAWQYQKTPEIWAYLYENIARERFKKRK
nr:P-loop NTPase fold protein [Spirochaetaceae bacterium]